MDRKTYLFALIFWLLASNLNAQESRKMLLFNGAIGFKDFGFILTSMDYSYHKNKFWFHAQIGLESIGNYVPFEQVSCFYSAIQNKKSKIYVGVSQVFTTIYGPNYYRTLKFCGVIRTLHKDSYCLELGLGIFHRNINFFSYSEKNLVRITYLASFGYLLPLWKSKDSPSE